MESRDRSFARKLVLAVAAVAGAVVVLAFALVLLVDSDAATRRVVELVLPRASSALGREVTVENAKLRIFPNPRVSLGGLVIAGRSGEPALVEADALEVEVGLWPLLRSFGKQIEVRSFTLLHPTVNLVRARDGTWNYEGLGGEPAQEDTTRSPVPQPGEEAKVTVSDVEVSGGAVRVIDRSAGNDDAGVALEDIDLEASGVAPGHPLRARVAAAFASDKQNLHASVTVTRLPDGVPQRPEDWPEIQGSLSLGAVAIERIRTLLPGELGAVVRGGIARLDAALATGEDGTYRIEGSGELTSVRLRGQAASGRFRATASWSPARPNAARVEVTDLALRGPGVDLGGKISFATSPVRASFALAGPLLDLDAVMGLFPESEPMAKQPSVAGSEVVPEATRRQINAAAVRGTISIEELRAGRIRATRVEALAVLRGGMLSLEKMGASVFGGRVSAAGTRVSLDREEPTWNLAASLSGIDLGAAIKAFAGHTPLLGKVDGTLRIAGTGTDWSRMRDELSGLVKLTVKNGSLTSADLGGEVLGGISQGLRAAGRGDLAKRLGRLASARTDFRDLSGEFSVKDGFLQAESPIELHADSYDVSLEGRLGLDERLDLRGVALVPKETLSRVLPGIPLPASIEVPFVLGGTLSSPDVTVRGKQAVSALLKGEARRAAQGVREKTERAGRRQVQKLFRRFGGKR